MAWLHVIQPVLLLFFFVSVEQEGALISVWGAVITSAGALAWTASELGVVRVLNIVVFVALVGVWATLQFRFIYREDQDIARLLERYLDCSSIAAVRRLIVDFFSPTRVLAPYVKPFRGLGPSLTGGF